MAVPPSSFFDLVPLESETRLFLLELLHLLEEAPHFLVVQHAPALSLDQLEGPLAGRAQVVFDLVPDLVQLELQAEQLDLPQRLIDCFGGPLPDRRPAGAEIVFELAESRIHDTDASSSFSRHRRSRAALSSACSCRASSGSRS